MTRKIVTVAIVIMMAVSGLYACAVGDDVNPALDTSKEITLTVAGGAEDPVGMEAIAESFTKKYPNCHIVYEYMQDYGNTLPKRLASADSGIDLFITSNIQADSPNLPYALELFSHADVLDLSQTFSGLIDNFTFVATDANAAKQIYAIPLGAELRGMYVNKTLLASLGLQVPTDREEFMNCCQVLLEHGYVPIQGNPSTVGQQLFYPYICNLVANASDYDTVHAAVESRQASAAEYFREPLQLLYDIVKDGYYNYKHVETDLGLFVDGKVVTSTYDFLNIVKGADGSYKAGSDVGQVAFMPSIMSLNSNLARAKEDYHSAIDYEFILSPLGPDGGYAYMSPADGIAINKNSAHTDWALEFLDFMFKPANNKVFAKEQGLTPNVKDAFSQIKERFSIADDRISQLGSVTFSYNFFSICKKTLTDISKANNPKYMMTAADGSVSMYGFDYYMEIFTARLTGASD